MRNSRPKLGGIVVALCVLVWGTVGRASSPIPSTRPAAIAARAWIPKGFHAVRDVPYVLHGRRSQVLDVYVPDVRGLPRPVMVWIHGGGWYSGDKSSPPGLGMLPRGYVVASINYRLSSEALFPAQIFDCKAAIRFLRRTRGNMTSIQRGSAFGVIRRVGNCRRCWVQQMAERNTKVRRETQESQAMSRRCAIGSDLRIFFWLRT